VNHENILYYNFFFLWSSNPTRSQAASLVRFWDHTN